MSTKTRNAWSFGAFEPAAWLMFVCGIVILGDALLQTSAWNWHRRLDLGVGIYIVIFVGFGLWQTRRAKRSPPS